MKRESKPIVGRKSYTTAAVFFTANIYVVFINVVH